MEVSGMSTGASIRGFSSEIRLPGPPQRDELIRQRGRERVARLRIDFIDERGQRVRRLFRH
jgi:hypothetical protein